jgi:hypothetical protein
MTQQENAVPCAFCGTRLGRRRDRTPLGLVHPACGVEYRRRHAGRGDYDSRLPKHLAAS